MPLTQSRAQARTKYIKQDSISYRFCLKLKEESYEGHAQLFFHLNDIPEPLFIDFQSQIVKKIIVNAKQVQFLHQNKEFIIVKANFLKIGRNQILVSYENKYDKKGEGCTLSRVDGKKYLFTQFEPYHACLVFPLFALFDQPDLKAKMILSVLFSQEWKRVISNQIPLVNGKQFDKEQYLSTVGPINKEMIGEFTDGFEGKMTIFKETKLISSYLYAFVVGDYEQFKIEQTYKNIPMSIFYTKQMKQNAQKVIPFISSAINQSIKFFEDFFNYSFPFSKYDQIFIAGHNYNDNAMQNVGCVTVNGGQIRYLELDQDLPNLLSTLIHELAHHWFGNLVTMKWWNDLWLNQSVTEFMCLLCLKNIKCGYQEQLNQLFCMESPSRYHHECIIRRPVSDTSETDELFDDVMYEKGTSVIKQLYFLLGEENFRNGIASFINRFEYRNASLQDFIAQMQKYSQITQFSLKEWAKLWLQEYSFNVLQSIEFLPENKSPQAQFIIKMSSFSKKNQALRPHKIKIALIKEDFTMDIIQTLLQAQQYNKIRYNGTKNYRAIFLNHEGYSFVKCKLDKHSKQFLKTNKNKLNEQLQEQLSDMEDDQNQEQYFCGDIFG